MRQIDRGIAQLVEQRSPKPRAVSSRLTTPATNAQVLRSLCVLFLRFRIGSASLCQYQWKNYFYLHFRKICGFSGSVFSRKGSFRGAILFIYSTCYGQGRSGKQHFYFRHLPRLGLPNSFRQLQREGSLSEGAATAQAVTEGVPHIFSDF